MNTSLALKEWSLSIEALTTGLMPLLLRKGGIQEEMGQFNCPYPRALFLPSFEHQDPKALKPSVLKKLPRLTTPNQGKINIRAWAEFTTAVPINSQLDLTLLSPFYIWTDDFVATRLNWKPHKPLWMLLCRVYRLIDPIQLEWHTHYGGCRSWIELDQSFALSDSQPVIPQKRYDQIVDAVHKITCDTAH